MRFIKLSVAAFAAVAIIAALAFMPERLCFKGGERYVFYCGTSSADCREVYGGDSAALTRLTLKEVCGESVEYENFSLSDFLNEYGAEIAFVEEGEDYINYYCTADLPYSVELYGRQINLHVCVRGKRAKVGSPIIFGGY